MMSKLVGTLHELKNPGGILFGCFGKTNPGGEFHHLFKGDGFFSKAQNGNMRYFLYLKLLLPEFFEPSKKLGFTTNPRIFV